MPSLAPLFKSTRLQQSHRFGAFTPFHGKEADMNLVATLFNGCETALPAFANAYNTFLRDGRYMTLRRFAMHFLCIHTDYFFYRGKASANSTQTLTFYRLLHYALKTQLKLLFMPLRATLPQFSRLGTWCPAFVCVCVVGVVYLLGGGGSGFFSYAIHMYIRGKD